MKFIITAILITFCFTSCSTNNFDYSVSVQDNDIVIQTSNPDIFSFTIERKYSPAGTSYIFDNGTMSKFSIKDSLTSSMSNKESINTLEILESSSNKMSIAYEYSVTNKIAWRLYNNIIDTVIYTTPFYAETNDSLYANLKSGIAAKLTRSSNSHIKEIKSYLYDQKIQFSDSLIMSMNNILNQLNRSEYDEFSTEDNIPIIKSLAGIKYNISTNMKADYYYLFATDSENDLNEFIKEVSLNDFEMGEKNIKKSLNCFRSTDKGGCLTLFFIGLNRDWSKNIIPVGMVAIDNIKPFVLSDNYNSSENSLLSSIQKNNEPKDLLFASEGIKVITPSNYPKIAGMILISTNSFRGNHANFEFQLFEDSDIVSLSIKREVHRDFMKWMMSPETKTIKLTDKKSPYHFTYELDLGIGDNYIPITVTDKRGNKSELSYKITMEQVEDSSPDINIDNNIDIY